MLSKPVPKRFAYSHIITINGVTVHYHVFSYTQEQADAKIKDVNYKLHQMLYPNNQTDVKKFEDALGIKIITLDAPHLRAKQEPPGAGIYG